MAKREPDFLNQLTSQLTPVKKKVMEKTQSTD